MNFTPLESLGRGTSGAELGYSILGLKKKKPVLMISISPPLVRKLKIKDGDILRLDADRKAGMGRLLPVTNGGKAARKVGVATSGRASWKVACTGEVAEVFPVVDGVTELTSPDVGSDGLLFELPKKAK
ncbi:MAG: hypothetical protein ACO1TE_29115 [Prosthecobacter sp.]